MKYSINGQRRLMSLIEPVFLAHWADRLLARLPLFFSGVWKVKSEDPPFYGLGPLWFNV